MRKLIARSIYTVAYGLVHVACAVEQEDPDWRYFWDGLRDIWVAEPTVDSEFSKLYDFDIPDPEDRH